MNDKELANLINGWFKTNSNDPNKWNRNAAGIAIQAGVKACGNWKNAPRGNPRRAHRAMRETIARRNGWEPEEQEREEW